MNESDIFIKCKKKEGTRQARNERWVILEDCENDEWVACRN